LVTRSDRVQRLKSSQSASSSAPSSGRKICSHGPELPSFGPPPIPSQRPSGEMANAFTGCACPKVGVSSIWRSTSPVRTLKRRTALPLLKAAVLPSGVIAIWAPKVRPIGAPQNSKKAQIRQGHHLFRNEGGDAFVREKLGDEIERPPYSR
jgi:hypothetical protein